MGAVHSVDRNGVVCRWSHESPRERQPTARPANGAMKEVWPGHCLAALTVSRLARTCSSTHAHTPEIRSRRRWQETPSQVQISVDFSASRRSRSSSICVYDTPRVPSPRDPRTVAGARKHRRPRSVPTTKRRRMTCVRPASLCLQGDNVARTPTTTTTTTTAPVDGAPTRGGPRHQSLLWIAMRLFYFDLKKLKASHDTMTIFYYNLQR